MVGFVCAMAAAACAWPNGLNDGGALRETIHRTPVPAQTMHSRACRRLIASSPLSWSLAMMFFLSNVLIRLITDTIDRRKDLFPLPRSHGATRCACGGLRSRILAGISSEEM